MPRRYFLINLALLVIAVFLGFKLYKAFSKPLDIPLQASEKIQRLKTEKSANAKPELNIIDYETIVQKDLFRPSRFTAPPEMSVPLEKPKLFGTIIMDSGKSAILEDPITKTKKLYNLNDSISGFIVSDIQEDKVIFLRGTEKIEVMLREVKGGASMMRPPARPQMPPQLPQPVTRPRIVPTPRRSLPQVPAQPPMPMPEEQPPEPNPFETE